jgi:SSS family transporter
VNGVFLGILAYVVLQFAIGVWVSRRVKTTTDFLIAGRSLGVGLVTFSIYASFFGAEAIVGNSGSVYEGGLSGGQVDPFGYAIAIAIAAVVFAAPLWRRGIITFADLFRERYSPAVEKLVVLVLLPGSLFWAAAQLRAFGHVMSSASGLDVTTAIGLAYLFVVGYTMLGGLLADAWTDVVQGLAIVLGLVVLAAIVVVEAGSVTGSLAQVEAERLQPFTLGEAGIIGFLERMAVPICGTIVAVELISRFLGARSPEVAVTGALYGAVIYVIVGLIPVFLGLVGPQLVPGLEDAEQIIPRLAEAYLPSFFYVLFAGAVISAILSTVDTTLLASSGQVSHNIIERLVPSLDDRRRLLLNRGMLAVLAAVALLIALRSDKVKDLVETASAAGSAGVFVVVVFALFSKFGGPLAAISTIIVGSGSWLLFGSLLPVDTPYLAALGLGFMTYAGVALIERQGGTAETLAKG